MAVVSRSLGYTSESARSVAPSSASPALRPSGIAQPTADPLAKASQQPRLEPTRFRRCSQGTERQSDIDSAINGNVRLRHLSVAYEIHQIHPSITASSSAGRVRLVSATERVSSVKWLQCVRNAVYQFVFRPLFPLSTGFPPSRARSHETCAPVQVRARTY